MSTAKKFAGQTAVYGVSTIASRVLPVFLTPIYVRSFKVGAFGIITTMYSYVSMINALLSFGMETTFFRYLNKHTDNKQRVYNNAFASVFVITIIFILFSFLFIGDIANFVDVTAAEKMAAKGIHLKAAIGTSHADFVKYVYLFLSIVVVDAWCAIPFVKIRAEGRPGRYGMIKLASVITYVALSLVFIKVIPFWLSHNLTGANWIKTWYVNGWVGYVFVAELTSSIITLLLLLPELLKIRFDFDRAMLLNMYSYGWPIMIANISYLINENLDKILLGKLLTHNGLQETGIYGACGKIAVFLSIFINAFRLGAEPFFFSQAKNKNAGETYARIMNYFIIVVAVIFVAIVSNIQILKYFITGNTEAERQLYWSGLKVVPILLFGYVSLGIYMNLSIWYKLSDQTKYGLYISVIGAVLTIVLNFIFIPLYSYMASAWISLTAYTTMMVLSYLWGQKNYPIPYNIKKNLAYIITAIVLVYLSFYVFNRNIFVGNGLLLLFVLGAAYFERRELKIIFSKK